MGTFDRFQCVWYIHFIAIEVENKIAVPLELLPKPRLSSNCHRYRGWVVTATATEFSSDY